MTVGQDSPDPPDETLLAAHVAGDPDAFAEIVRRHRDRLWGVALRTTGNPDEAADALQDALLSAFRRAETFRGDAQVSTWLHRIVVNACLDRLRRRKSHPTTPLPDEDDHRAVLADDAPDHDPAERSARRADVLGALGRLTEEQRTAVVLVHIEGYSVEEVAALIDCAPGTVKSRCARGRLRLAELLAQYGGNPDPPSSVQPRPPGSHPTAPDDDRGHPS